MNTIYLPNTQEILDLLDAIQDAIGKGKLEFEECIEVKTDHTPTASFLKAVATAGLNGNGKSHTGEIEEERICKRCKLTFNPVRPNQYTCSKCLTELGRSRMAKKTPTDAAGHTPPEADPS